MAIFKEQRYLDRQARLFGRCTGDLISKGYRGKYVAFENGNVIDSDIDRHELTVRVHEKYGWGKPIFSERVESERDRKKAMPSVMVRSEG